MRPLLPLLFLLSSATAVAAPQERAPTRNWSAALAADSHYQGRAGIGLSDLLAQPAPQQLAPLDELLASTRMFETWPEARALVEARAFALRWVVPTCDTHLRRGDAATLRREANVLASQLDELREAIPKKSALHVRRLSRQLRSLARRPRNRVQAALRCKTYVGVLTRTGWALADLHRALPHSP